MPPAGEINTIFTHSGGKKKQLVCKLTYLGVADSFKKDGQSDVPLYFVLYYTLNRSGEIHGKK